VGEGRVRGDGAYLSHPHPGLLPSREKGARNRLKRGKGIDRVRDNGQ